MSDGRAQNWLKLLCGGIGVAAFSFAAPIVWKTVSHRTVGPDYVNATLRVEDSALLLLVRNNSDEPLDLVEAEFEIDGATNVATEFGAYPEPSHLYAVGSKSDTELRQQDGRIFIKMRIAQAIDPGHVDQFGLRIKGSAGSLTPAAGSVSGKIKDVRGNSYLVKY